MEREGEYGSEDSQGGVIEAPETEVWERDRVIAGRYRIERVLGRGSMGAVYLAEDRLLNKHIALKVLHPELARSRDTVRRFLREVALAHSVTHPNVVRIYDTGEEDGLPFFTMEYLQGQTLEELLDSPHGRERDEALSTRRIRTISCEVLDAVGAAHAAGIVHRDLKPGNVMLTHRGAIVMDFGVAGIDSLQGKPSAAKIASLVRTEIGTIFGSPAYMAPELWEGDPASPQSDLYAFAVMLYQMLADRLPYEAKTPAAYLQKLNAGPPPSVRSFRRDVPWALIRLIERCMATDPAKRPPSANAAANLLSPLRYRRRRLFAGIGVAVVAAVLGTLAVRAAPRWKAYGLADAVAEADLATAVRAYDVGDLRTSWRLLEAVAERSPESAAGIFWRATIAHELGNEAARLEACKAEAARGSSQWKELAEAVCGERYELPPSAWLDGQTAPVGPQLTPLAVMHGLIPRLEANPADEQLLERAEDLRHELADPPDWRPQWATPLRWQIARIELELVLGNLGRAAGRPNKAAADQFRELAEEFPRAPIVHERLGTLLLLTGDRELAGEIAQRLRSYDPSLAIRLELDAGHLEKAWLSIEAHEGSPRFEYLRNMWCGYAWRFRTPSKPARCGDLPMGLVAALWNEDGQSGRLDPLSEAVIERTAQLQLGACTSETRRPLVVSHAPAPFELYLAELEVKAALCERDREKTDLTYADDLSSRLLATTQTKDPWTQLLQARIDLARGQPRLARAHRLMAAEYWQTADPHLPLVADLRDYVADDDPPLARLEGIEDAARP